MKLTPLKVIKRVQIPTRLPFIGTLTVILAIDRWHPPGWLIGVIGTIGLVIWIGAIINFIREEDVEIKL